ncbi:MAG TPA: hypothetical protein VFB33_05905 [Candidatus Binataceae bacterium]|jgi:hypothetical protein|nr:hypothetical protein [Candidatus Binataceae bacterium]
MKINRLFFSMAALGAFLLLSLSAARADNQKSDFALFDQEAPTPDVSVQCGAAKAAGSARAPFVMYITMSNRGDIGGANGFVHVKYRDGDSVDYAIPVNTSLQITLAGGSTPGTDNVIEVTGSGGAVLVGQVSIMTQNGVKPPILLGGKSFCTTTPFGGTPPFPLF